MVLPKRVRETLEKIREEREHYVYAKKSNESYYLLEYIGRWDKELKKVRMKTIYLGKIDKNGKFEEAKHRKPKAKDTEIPDRIYRLITESKTRKEDLQLVKKGNMTYVYSIAGEAPVYLGRFFEDGRVIKANEDNYEAKKASTEIQDPDSIDLKILTLLSVNARSTIKAIAKTVGLSASATRHRVDKLEKRYGIKYTLEFGYSFFGFFRFVVLVRFLGSKPEPEVLRSVLDKEPTIQYAALMKGSYDLFIYMLAENTRMLEVKLYQLESDPAFAPFPSYRYVSYITYSYGYIPMRDAFFEVLKDRVWHRSKESPRRAPDKILESDYLVLKELNENGNIDFADIDKKYNLGRGAAQYTYHRLLERKIIYRITITMQNLPMKYAMMVKANQLDMKEFNDNRELYLSDITKNTETPVNKYALVGDVTFPRGLFFAVPIFTDGDTEAAEKGIQNIVRGSEIESAITTETLIGSLGLRKFDNALSKQFNLIPIYKKGLKTITTSEEDY